MPVDVEPVGDVAVRRVPQPRQEPDRLAGRLDGHRFVEEELAADGIDDGCALVADDRLGDPGLLEVRTHRPEHTAGRHEHGDTRSLRSRDRRPRPRSQKRVAPDQGAVEIAGERPHVRREGGREDQLPPVACTTYAATSAICWSVSCPANGGIAPIPFVTRVMTRSLSGFASSRFGPTVPVAPASASV